MVVGDEKGCCYIIITIVCCYVHVRQAYIPTFVKYEAFYVSYPAWIVFEQSNAVYIVTAGLYYVFVYYGTVQKKVAIVSRQVCKSSHNSLCRQFSMKQL